MTNNADTNNKKDGFDRKGHWEHIYSDKKSTEVSWYQLSPEISLSLIEDLALAPSANIIDVGGGASTLVDFLLMAGYQNISVLDIAHSAIEQTRDRLQQLADRVEWLEKDVTAFEADIRYDLWHDRAVFHFLTDAEDREKYVESVYRALRSGGHAIIATFNLDGPEKCSGLDIVRYSSETLSDVLGDRFKLLETRAEEHMTPSGASQHFVYCHFEKI
jgi:SAM-dependent methyltransferase